MACLARVAGRIARWAGEVGVVLKIVVQIFVSYFQDEANLFSEDLLKGFTSKF